MALFSMLGKLTERLARSREAIAGRVAALLAGRRLDEDTLDELRDILIGADVGIPTTEKLVAAIQDKFSGADSKDSSGALEILQREVAAIMSSGDCALNRATSGPTVILVVGVNGSGKTTTIGKLACRLRKEGSKVLLAASDTYRPAAIQQLEIWAQRSGAGIVKHEMGSDPSAVVYDSLEAAQARGVDYVILDTAGRLQTKATLMEELSKIGRVAAKRVPEAPHEVLIVIDSTVGQNALSQVRLFNEAIDITGIVMTKLDGTAKGGVLLAVRDQIDVPVKFVGVGEGEDDLEPFDPDAFAQALFG